MVKIKNIDVEVPSRHLINWLRSQKLRRIGSGSYGEVYGRKGFKRVFKIGDIDENSAYLDFVFKVIKQRKQNPYLPRIHNVTFFRHKPNIDNDYAEREICDYFLIEMERLDKLPRSYGRVVGWFEDIIDGESDYMTDPNILKTLGIKFPKDLLTVIDIIQKLCCNHGSDLHRGNFMMRGRQIVVTDPVA